MPRLSGSRSVEAGTRRWRIEVGVPRASSREPGSPCRLRCFRVLSPAARAHQLSAVVIRFRHAASAAFWVITGPAVLGRVAFGIIDLDEGTAQIAVRLERQPAERLRRAAADAVGVALHRIRLGAPRLDAALAALHDARYRDVVLDQPDVTALPGLGPPRPGQPRSACLVPFR